MPGINGLTVVAPTSVVVAGAGSSATINANGSVTYTSCTSLSLNGIFTSTYDNYLVSASIKGSYQATVLMRFRAGGVNDASTTATSSQLVQTFTATAPAASRSPLAYISNIGALHQSGITQYIFSPKLTQPTQHRSETVSGHNNGMIFTVAGINSLSTSWDGVTYQGGSMAFTGSLTVYGFTK